MLPASIYLAGLVFYLSGLLHRGARRSLCVVCGACQVLLVLDIDHDPIASLDERRDLDGDADVELGDLSAAALELLDGAGELPGGEEGEHFAPLIEHNLALHALLQELLEAFHELGGDEDVLEGVGVLEDEFRALVVQVDHFDVGHEDLFDLLVGAQFLLPCRACLHVSQVEHREGLAVCDVDGCFHHNTLRSSVLDDLPPLHVRGIH
mmetsp:Transcript_45783/g.108570  ORF Transcript_45783/g.108570 Transcript_45783/m.108570 type:complete len:208 (+) Transcript_45783:171-794(+)